MFGRNAAKARSARPSKSDPVVPPEGPTRRRGHRGGHRQPGDHETDSLVILQGGFFNGNVANIREHDVHSGPRPVHLVEDKRLGAQK